MRDRRRPTRVVDPMAGSGIVLVAARACGREAVGVDSDPLAVLIARVWTAPVDTGAVAEKAAAVLKSAARDLKGRRPDAMYPAGADEETRRFVDYWFDPEAGGSPPRRCPRPSGACATAPSRTRCGAPFRA